MAAYNFLKRKPLTKTHNETQDCSSLLLSLIVAQIWGGDLELGVISILMSPLWNTLLVTLMKMLNSMK